jgi:dienelactone hydrolase
MKKDALMFLCFVLLSFFGFAQILKTKLIDDGGSGPYKAIAVTDKTLADFVIYRPEAIKPANHREGKLPILVWANGGCMDSSIHHERLLTEVASHGYIILAIGKLQMTVEERAHEKTSDKELLVGIEWITIQVNDENSKYYQVADIDKIAACGMSCGGAQVMAVADDPRIKTYMMFNSGMGDLSMAGADRTSLKKLHASIIYILGGKTDVAYENALLDVERINTVPMAFTSLKGVGHGGTFDEKYGGSFALLTLDWLDWQFKEKDNAEIFLKGDPLKYPDWTMKTKNFQW